MPGICASLLLLGVITAAPPQDPPPDPTVDPAEARPTEGPSQEPSAAPPPELAGAPGGYWSAGEQRARRGEPPDGDDELTIGSVLFSLGLLRTGAAVVTVWMARTPSRCPADDPAGCNSMAIYGWVGFGEGGLMVGTGLTYLIIGAVRRGRHRRWQGGESVALRRLEHAAGRVQVGSWLIPPGVDRPGVADPVVVGGGMQLRVRF